MRKGKLAAQVAHASVQSVVFNTHNYKVTRWLESGMAKIVVGCDSEDELFQLEEQARQAGILTSIVTDAGKTEFKEPTITVLAIGPDDDHKVDSITKNLGLL